MELHDSLQWWQIAIRLVWLVLFVVGIVRLVGRKRVNRTVAMAMVGVAVLGFLATKKITEPAVHREPAARPAPAADRVHIVSERGFDSSDDPAVVVDAPDGWKVAFVDADRMVILSRDTPSAARLTIQSSHLQEDADVGHLMSLVKPQFESLGFSANEPTFNDTVDGLPALGLLVRRKDDTACSWLLQRGPRYVTTVQCTAIGAPDAREACLAPLQRIRWRTPAVH